MPNIGKTVYCRADNRLNAGIIFAFSEKSTNLAKNTSIIQWRVQANQGGITFVGHNRASGAVVEAYINGTKIISRAIGLTDSPSSWNQTGAIEVAHNSDGNKTITCSLNIKAGGGNYAGDPWTYGGASGSTSLKLTRLARVSDVFCPSCQIAGTAKITIKPQSSSFTHTISYAFGKQSGTLMNKGKDTTINWEIPIEFASEIPNAASGTCKLTCQTWSGNTLVGSKTINVKITIGSGVIPTLDSITVSPFSDKVPKDWNLYIQGKSQAQVTVNGAKGMWGSTISKYTIYMNNVVIGNAQSVTSSILSLSGKITFKATVTDSRGQTSKPVEVSVNVEPYGLPEITDYTLSRCTADGTITDDGTCGLATIAFSNSSCAGKNSVTTDILYRKSGTETWTDSKAQFSNNNPVVFGQAQLSTDSSYDVQFKITDAFGSTTVTYMLSTAEVIIDFQSGGHGIAFGKVAEKKEAVEINPNWSLWTHGKEVRDLIKAEMELLWPIGSVYITVANINPSYFFGFGTWERFGQGRTLLGAGDKNFPDQSTGGSSTHTLSVDEMPSHNHNLSADGTAHSFSWGGHGHTVYAPVSAAAGNGSANDINTRQGAWSKTQNTGGGKAFSIMPPYIVVYFFRRTA